MGGPVSPTEPSITLHSTWSGLIMAYLGALIAVLFAGALLLTADVNLITISLGIGALILAAVVLFDMPVASEFNQHGIVRRALLRQQFLPWERVTRMKRLRVGILRGAKDKRGGGLIADMKGKKSVLVDTMESRVEYDDLKRVLGERAELLGMTDDLRPPDLRSPTWLYRRDKWKPDSAR